MGLHYLGATVRPNEPVITKTWLGLFSTMGQAARAHGVAPTTVRHAMENGTLDGVGKGKSRPRAFEYGGKTYRSQAECARAYGVPTNTFNDRLNKGRDPVTGA